MLKSVWDNEKNFDEFQYKGCGDWMTNFTPPYFLR